MLKTTLKELETKRPTFNTKVNPYDNLDSLGAGDLRKLFEVNKDVDIAMRLIGEFSTYRLSEGAEKFPPLSSVVSLLIVSNATPNQFVVAFQAMLTNLYNTVIEKKVTEKNMQLYYSLYKNVDELLYDILDHYRDRIQSEKAFQHIELMTIKLLQAVLYKLYFGTIEETEYYGSRRTTDSYSATTDFLGNYTITPNKSGGTESYSRPVSVLEKLGIASKKEEFRTTINSLRGEMRRRDPSFRFSPNETNIKNNKYFNGFPGSCVLAEDNAGFKPTFKRVHFIFYGLVYFAAASIPCVLAAILIMNKLSPDTATHFPALFYFYLCVPLLGSFFLFYIGYLFANIKSRRIKRSNLL